MSFGQFMFAFVSLLLFLAWLVAAEYLPFMLVGTLVALSVCFLFRKPIERAYKRMEREINDASDETANIIVSLSSILMAAILFGAAYIIYNFVPHTTGRELAVWILVIHGVGLLLYLYHVLGDPPGPQEPTPEPPKLKTTEEKIDELLKKNK